MGIALLPGRRLAVVETEDPVTFARWARVMYADGAVDAMNLDAGASLALYVRGRTVIPPGRDLTNILTVSE
jgi:exopolysaccharide biosynthesis protein